MRLHTLTVTAFGPFRRSVEVDFDRVCSAGLFLIHGATGAGKTSLLDAICFALFADVPGARTKKGLASDHATEGTRPIVTLEFSVGNRRLRIERSPEFHRPKRRGTGLTKVPAAVTLEERTSGGWRGVSTRHDEVADALDQVLGMGMAQFAKVVVLPQGDVSAFLRATPEDRRALLERLFDISTFTGVEEWFVEERRRTSVQVDLQMAAIEREVARLSDLVNVEEAPQWAALELGSLPAALAGHLAEVEAEVLTLLAAADEAAGALTRAGTTLQEVRTTSAARDRGLSARADQTAALEAADEIADLRTVVAAAAAADAVAGHLAGLDAALHEESQRARDLAAAQHRVGLHPDAQPGDAVGPAAVLREDIADLAERLHTWDRTLSDLEHAAASRVHAIAAVERAQSTVQRSEAAVAAFADRTRCATESAANAESQVQDLSEVAKGHAAADSACATARRALGLATEVARLVRDREESSPDLIAARDAVLRAQSEVIALRQRRLDGMAAELAAALTPGETCPVCGSAQHPAPARGEAAVSPEDLEGAEASLAHVQSRLVALEVGAAARASRIEALSEQLGDDAGRELGELVTARDEAHGRLAVCLTARRDLQAAQTLLTASRAELTDVQNEAVSVAASSAAATATLQTAQATVAQLSATIDDRMAQHAACPCAAEEDSGIDTVGRTHTSMTAAVDALLTAQSVHADAVTRREDRETAALAAAAARGFADLAAARRAVVSPERVETMRSRISNHAELLAVSAATLDEPSVAAALAGPEPDVQGATEAESYVRRNALQTRSAHTAAEGRFALLRSVSGTVTRLIAEIEPRRARAAAIKDLADAATGVGGGNLLRMRLASFVLAARLEKVVTLANERLQRMDAGRYLLEHSDARVAGGARSGLDLRVLDQWTGRTRETASLSGGESFMVSLALALGLADAVREEAGGFDLGTLFIDEGFGSLDEESLEHVMGVLDGLREGGRAVGVVSHVPDLRTRISHQVVVEKTATGSEVSVRTVA
ncbi:MAG: SMC family ATPase [Intrasporangiaceae bacterium]|nr:SMC family ATPase [Intrasporangiaceae bacterium]